MWSAVRRSPLRFVYRQYGECDSPEVHASSLPLDPVSSDNIANIRNPASNFLFGRRAWGSINDPHFFYSCVVLQDRNIDPMVRRTTLDYAEHVRCLKEWGLVSEVTRADVEVACKYFAVVKRAADPANDLARTIYDGRPFNSQCKRPPPVNIPDPVDVSRFMSTIPANKLCVYLADFRHFFHQFGLHEKIKRYFGLAIGESMFAWNTLPMGFSWAPFVAQGTAMALAADATRKYHVRDYTNDSGIPHYIETKKGSRIYLTYDNLAVIGSNKREVQELRDAIMLRMRGTVDAGDAQIAENSANVKVKEEFMCHGRSLRTNYKESDADKNNCCHLGVQYGIHKNELFVRVAPKTAKRWAHDFQQFNRSTATKRDVARICGIVLHAERIRHRALYEQPHLLAAMRSLYPIENWDAPAAVSDELFDMLNAAFLNPWTPLSKLSSEPIDCVIASDASGTGVGYIIYDAKQRCVNRTLAEPSVFPKHDDPHQAHSF